jgi:long-chain acyl-CoA synthetase
LGDLEMPDHDELKKIIDGHVKNINNTLAPFEQVKRHQIIHSIWGVETGEITPKLSLRRKVIAEKHKGIIHKIFGEG